MAPREVQVRADRLQPGHRVTYVPGARVRQKRGQWPVVVSAAYHAHAAEMAGGPLVLLVLSDNPRGAVPLHGRELVTVLDDGGGR
jgi:hypothetical protein